MPKWEYLTVKLGNFGFNNDHVAAQFVNERELKDWKRTSLHEFANRLGEDGWEMAGTISVTYGGCSYLFFRRPKP